MVLLCLGNAIGAYFWDISVGSSINYIGDRDSRSQLGLPMNAGTFILESFLTFVVGYSHLIPISLYFGLEMIKVRNLDTQLKD